MIAEYEGKVRFVEEDYADAEMARERGINRYPAFFIADSLFAEPTDFYAWGGTSKPKYAPWTSEVVRERFGTELRAAIDRALAGEELEERAPRRAPALTMPEFSVTDRSGEIISSDSYRGEVTLIEFWATWCVPCKISLPWLADAAERHRDGMRAVTIALDSPPEKVEEWVERTPGPLQWTFGDAEVRAAFGTVPVVPSLFVFDREGKLAGTFIGASAENHADLERLLNRLDPRPIAPQTQSIPAGVAAQVESLRPRVGTLRKEAANRLGQELDRVELLLKGGLPLAALDVLGEVAPQIHAEQMRRLSEEEILDLTEFEAHWAETMDTIYQREVELEIAGSARSTLQAALTQSAQQRARSYGRSSRPYAAEGDLDAGLYYLGQAEGLSAFAGFCMGLDLGADEDSDLPLDPGAVIEDCDALNLELVQTIAEQFRNRSLLAVNATLKLARDQQRDGRPAGALQQALKVRAQLEAIERAVEDAPEVADLRQRARALRDRLDAPAGTPDLAMLLLEEAEAGLRAKAPRDSDLRYIQALFDHVLPMLIGS